MDREIQTTSNAPVKALDLDQLEKAIAEIKPVKPMKLHTSDTFLDILRRGIPVAPAKEGWGPFEYYRGIPVITDPAVPKGKARLIQDGKVVAEFVMKEET